MISGLLDYLKRCKEAEIAAHAAHERCKQFVLDTKYNIIWNKAIEATAKMIEDDFDFCGDELTAAIEIRKLKR